MAPNPRRLDARLDALYAEIPRIECCGACDDSCGPIEMTVRERIRVEQRAGRKVECGRGATCSMLTPDRRCGVYEIRPLICRLWGVVESMPCPYGCKPERYLTDAEAYRLMMRAGEIGGWPSHDRMMRTLSEAAATMREDDFEALAREAGKLHERPTLNGRNVPRSVLER